MGGIGSGRKGRVGSNNHCKNAGISVSAEQDAWLTKEAARQSAILGWRVTRSNIMTKLITEQMKKSKET